jgi:F-type H+-transporting ATPase subunit delta
LAVSVARRYAQAVHNLLESPEDIDRVEKDLESIRSLMAALPSLGRIVSHPGVPVERRKAILDQALTGLDCHPAARGAVALLSLQRDLKHLPALVHHFRRLREERLGVASAQVTTALPLANGERPAWEDALSKVAGKPVRIEFHTDSSLIGGAVARIGSVLYDGSVRGSIQRIRQSLLGE